MAFKTSTAFRLLLVLVVALGCLGCDSNSSTEPDTSPFVGTYSGTTEQGKSIQFTVSSDGGDVYVSAFSYGIVLDQPSSGCLTFFAEAEVDVQLQRLVIDPAGFRIEIPEDVPILAALPMDVTWVGSLSGSSATGTLFGEQEAGGGFGTCGGTGLATWTATRI